MNLNPKLVDALLKALRDDKLSNEDKAQIRELLLKAEQGKFTLNDFASCMKILFQLHELFKQYLE